MRIFLFSLFSNRLAEPIGDSAAATASKVPADNDFHATFTRDILKDFIAEEEAHYAIVTKGTERVARFLLINKSNCAQPLSKWNTVKRLADEAVAVASDAWYFCDARFRFSYAYLYIYYATAVSEKGKNVKKYIYRYARTSFRDCTK